MASREVQSILDYIEAAKIPYRITGILGQYISSTNPCYPHSRTSLHCAEGTGGKGLAVDLGGAVPGVTTQTIAQMCAIRHAFDPVAPHLAELFFNGPGITKVVKNGVWRDGLACLGSVTWVAHRTHVHVAVPRGTFLVPPFTPAPLPAPSSREVTGVRIRAGNIPVGGLDGNGRGWVAIPAPLDRVLFIGTQGSAPLRDGYWPPVGWDVNDSGPETIVTLDGKPGQATTVYFKILIEEA